MIKGKWGGSLSSSGWSLVAGAILVLVLGVGVYTLQQPRQGYYKYGPDPLAIKENCDELKASVEEYVKNKPGTFGVYYFDLKTGAHFGINEKEPLPAASSIKIIPALYLYRQAAAGKISLEEEMTYNPDTDWAGGAGTIRWNAAPGQAYTLRELAKLLIRVSDNVAWKMLNRRLGLDNLKAFMRDLGGKTIYPEGQNWSTAEDLTTYMRAVLRFSEENPELGGLLIEDLTHTTSDKEGVPALLPGDVRVGHKVGALAGVANDVSVVLLPDRPYILTVLTKDVGASEDPGFEAIAEISRMVYDYKQRQKLPGGTPGQSSGENK